MANQCEMIVGFLVPHRCEHPALGKCIKCQRAYCDEHLQLKPEGLICLACQQGLDKPIALPVTAQNFSDADMATFAAASTTDLDESDKFADQS